MADQPRYFAIRHKPSGLFLPEVSHGRRRAGYTHNEPSDGPPRLHSTKQAARSALEWWLAGKYTVTWSGGPWDEDQGPVEKTTPVKTRRAVDMEIVTLELIEVLT